MWRHPKTVERGYDWTQPELYQHIAKVCERGKFDMVFFADLNYISDTYQGSLEPALRYATQAPEHDPVPLLSWMGAVTKRIGLGATLLNTDDVMAGVSRLMPVVQVEGMFPDGAKLITVHDPIRPGQQPVGASTANRPGELYVVPGDISINVGRKRVTIKVLNTADRPVQVGSHLHFFEANKALDFDRAAAFGMRLDVPAGSSRRFEPGESKTVTLVQVGGTGELSGFNGLTNGSIYSDEVKTRALEKARERGFRGA